MESPTSHKLEQVRTEPAPTPATPSDATPELQGVGRRSGTETEKRYRAIGKVPVRYTAVIVYNPGEIFLATPEQVAEVVKRGLAVELS